MSSLKVGGLVVDLKVKKFYGISWTLEDFILENDVTLPNGVVLPRGERYFTWKEAIALQRMGIFPKGYRLPTAKEFRNLVRNVGPLTIYKRLNFNICYGFKEYEGLYRTHDAKALVECGDLYSDYWSSSSGEKHNAVAFEISISGLPKRNLWVGAWMRTSYRRYANSIRLVYDPILS